VCEELYVLGAKQLFGVLQGFEKHVGRVTNVRFVTNPWLGFRVSIHQCARHHCVATQATQSYENGNAYNHTQERMQ
jgi:hypothetical protein